MTPGKKTAPLQYERKLALSFGAVVMVLILLATWAATFLFQRTQATEENRLCVTITTIVSESISRVSFSGKYHARQLVQELLRRAPELAFISVETPQGEVLAHSDPAQNDTTVDADELALTQRSLAKDGPELAERARSGIVVKEVVTPYRGGYDNQVQGVVRVGVLAEVTRNEQRINLLKLLALVSGLTVAAIIAVYLLSRRYGAATSTLARQLRGILDNTPLAIAISGSDGRILSSSKAFDAMLGRDDNAPSTGRLLRDIIPAPVLELLEEAAATDSGAWRRIERELRFAQDGATRFWHYTRFPISLSAAGTPLQYCTFIRDITEGKQAVEALRLANFRSDQALSLTKAGYWYVPLDGSGWYESSERAANLFGDPPREGWRYRIMEEWFANVEAGDKAASEKTLENFIAAAEGRIPEYNSIYAYKRPVDGRIVWIHALGAVVKNADGKPTDMYGVTQDISESKLAEEELRKAKDAAESANRAKSEFLANMSHEIRTPLNGVLGMLQLIKTGGVSGAVESYAEMGIRAGQRLTSLLGDILDLSRIEAGRMPLANKPFALCNIFTALAETFSPTHFSKRLSLEISAAPDVPPDLVGDEVRLRQILFNLVGNAMKFTDQGGVRVEVSTLLPHPSGLVRLLFIVNDTGLGIPDEKVDLICAPFTQVSGDFTRSHQGAGLGLAIAHHLVRAMRGTLTFESTEGQGTNVFLMLPFSIPEPSAIPVASGLGLEATSPAPLRLLLVEDEEISRLSALLTLERMGHQVDTANNGEEALDALRKSTYDCVLMDVQMDVMDGVEATRRIRDGSSGVLDAQVPIIAMTAYAMSGDRERFLEAGMNDYIAKPVQVAELKKALGRMAVQLGKREASA